MSTEMTIADALPARASGSTRNPIYAMKMLVLPMFLLAFGFTPLLILRGRSLLDRPYLSAFPLAVIAGVVLAWKGTRGLGTSSLVRDRLQSGLHSLDSQCSSSPRSQPGRGWAPRPR